MSHNLSVPAPRREWFRTESGGWASRPWSKRARAEYAANGGLFVQGAHDIETPPEHFERSEAGKKCNYRCQLHVGQRGYLDGGLDE